MSSDCHLDSSVPIPSYAAQLGLILAAQSGCLSSISVCLLLSRVSYIAFRNRSTPGLRFIRSRYLDLYLLGLLVSDFFQSIGDIMNVRWIATMDVDRGVFCTAQGVLGRLGEVGVAFCSMAIVFHTFAELFLRWRERASFTIPTLIISLSGLVMLFTTASTAGYTLLFGYPS